MKRWHLPSLAGSSDKIVDRQPGTDAPRRPSVDRLKPQVLFSEPQCRAIVLDLRAGEDIGHHQVRERALIEVLSGRISIEIADESVECEAGTLLMLEPSERHAVYGIEDSRLLLILAPWPASGDNAASEAPHDQHLPANATVQPLPSSSDPGSSGGQRTNSELVARGRGAGWAAA
jgi:quercetin dioxygenase-like cupin family protein